MSENNSNSSEEEEQLWKIKKVEASRTPDFDVACMDRNPEKIIFLHNYV